MRLPSPDGPVEPRAVPISRSGAGCTPENGRRREGPLAVDGAFRDLIEGAAVGVIVVTGGRIAYANPGALHLFGYASAREMIALRDYAALLAEHDRSALRRIIEALAAGRKVQPAYDAVGLRRDGTRFQLEVRPSVARWNGRPAVCAVVFDVTMRKDAEALAASQVAELAHVDRICTLGQMAATIMHEIAQPLTALGFAGGALGRLLSQPAPPLDAARRATETIAREAERMRDTINRIKEFSSGSGRRGEQLVPVDMAGAIEQALTLTAPAFKTAGVTSGSVYDRGAAHREVLADQVQLIQVIVNLLTNALDSLVASGAEDGKVVVRVRRAGAAVVVDVMDNGAGVPPEEGERIFDPFYSTKEKGVGVGLAVCRSIVESFHGSIRHLPAAGGRGAVFRMRVPAREGT